MKNRLPIVLASFLTLSARSLSGQGGECPGTWQQAATAGPAARTAHGMAYDSLHRQTVVFGGTGDIFGTTLFGDTWGWSGTAWTRLATNGPQARRDGQLAFDAARGRVVLFGGTDTELITGNRYFLETWEFDGATWTNRGTGGPPGRNAHGLVYDAKRQRVVLFGGGADHVASPNDVWEWNGTAWARITVPGARPAARLSPLMVYDSRRGRTVLFGGFDAVTGAGLSDTWEWDGAAWTRRDVAAPLPSDRSGAAIAFDDARGVTVLFGGANAAEVPIAGVWELDDSGWHARETAGPTPRIAPAMAYDAPRSRLVLFGGITRASGAFADTWERRVPVDAQRFVPIALDVATATAHFTTELSLTNRGDRDVSVTYLYTASLGDGSGTVVDTLAAGRQIVIPDALAFLRGKGLAIPTSDVAAQAGALVVSFGCASAPDAVSVTARTTTPTAAPLPVGSAGLAYAGLPSSATTTGLAGGLVVHGLRVNAGDRSNIAVYEASGNPVTLRVTAISGSGDGARVVLDGALALGAREWRQFSFGSTGLTSGRVLVERVSGSGSFGAYGVVNDNVTNDGSFIPPVPASTSVASWLVPVLVETARFQSELVLANGAESPVTLELAYRESLGPGGAGTVPLTLAAGEQRVIPSAIDFLRRSGVPLGEAGASRAGALRIRVVSGSPAGVWFAARTASTAAGGGQFGLFTPAIPAEGPVASEGTVPGLRSDATTRANAGFANAGASGADAVVLSAQVIDGADGLPKGDPFVINLEPGQWEQVDGVLSQRGVSSGWLRVVRVSGNAPWIAYGVLNDGGQPGQRTGDGAYVVMETPAPAPVAPGTIGAGGGTVTLADGSATLVVPAGALPSAVAVTLSRHGAAPLDPNLDAASLVDVGPAGFQLAIPATLTLRYAPARVPAGLAEERLGVHRLVGESWEASAAPAVQAAADTTSGSITVAGTYGVRRRASAAACTAAENRQLDFWLGSWAYSAAGVPPGTNEVTRDAEGCVVEENLTLQNGYHGRSVNLFDPTTAKWYQTFVDSTGGRMVLSGTRVADRMVLDESATRRHAWRSVDTNHVRLALEETGNGGTTWNEIFTALYTRR
ncbi:MAG: hypothetical protein ABIT01_03175 [Thermoanaerobaculia bacterium]